MKKISSLYVHIPFCESICSYCDFCKMFYDKDTCDKYINILLDELCSLNIDGKLKTIYIGGGTPSSLSINQLETILKNISVYLDNDYEFTIEVNPENVDEEKVKLFSKYGINRVSIGVQSFDENVLKTLNRKHTYIDVSKCVALLNKYNINNYSFDFIYGIRNQSVESLKNDLLLAVALKPKHLSFYSLILEDNTMLKINKYKEEEEDIVREQYDFVYSFLKENNYNRYEVSNFSLKGYESKHNLVYWNNEEYYAIGVGASSYVNGIRYTTSRNITSYLIGNINKDKFEVEKEKEYIMLKLRLDEGFNLNEYKSIFYEDFLIKYKSVVDQLLKEKLIAVENNNLKTTYEGMMLLDTILVKLMWGED